ncbi:MAG: cation:proton antiporter [bacterium]|nr:cation:proton antiporter [bacterium]
MDHGNQLTDITIVVTAALACGLLLGRFRQPAIVGYILAGVVLGPSVMGFVEDREQINFLAELGVLLLLFSIGMELDVSNFRSVIKFSFIVTGLQIAIATAVILLCSWPLGWPWELSVLVGFGVALSSTAVTIKLLEDVGEIDSETGRRAIGILIAQDLAFIPMMLFVSAIGAQEDITFNSVTTVVGSILILLVLLWFLARKRGIRLPVEALARGQADLIAVGVMALCFGAAAISGLFGISTAYGAFLAGLVLGSSTDRATLLRVTLPIQGVLLMVFFLSIGLLIDVMFIWENLEAILLMLILVTLGKTAMNVGILRFLKEPWPRAWLGGVALGQVGEFSFVLVALGLSTGAIDQEGYRLFIAVIALSLIISPVWLNSARRIQSLAPNVETLRELVARLYPFAAVSAERGISWVRRTHATIRRRKHSPALQDKRDDGPGS